MIEHPMLSADVAELIQRSPGRVRQLAYEGKLSPAARTPSGVMVFERTAVEAWLREREHGGRRS